MKLGLKGSDRTLESFKIFPYIAWGITVLFVLFVYKITLDLQEVTDTLSKQVAARQDEGAAESATTTVSE